MQRFSPIALLLLPCVAACAALERGASHQPSSPPPVSVSAAEPASFAPLPPNAHAAPELEPLRFLVGNWTAINPNKTVNEETWTPPRGNVLIGAFRQVRLDGDCSFVEMSQIALEGDEIVLRLRHLHGRMEVPKNREEISLFRLVSLNAQRVEFTGSAGAEGVASVVYERTGPHTLTQSIGFAAETGQEPFVTNYVLDAARRSAD